VAHRERLINLVLHDHWNVGVVRAPVQEFLRPGFRPEVDWFPPLPRGHFIADPMATWREGVMYVFFEEFDYWSQRGRIRYCMIDASGQISPASDALCPPFHVSYPFLVEHAGEVFMVPETHQDHCVALYRASRFPNSWQKETTLLQDWPGVDASLVQYDGRWWMFLIRYAYPPAFDLYVWYADDLFGPWRPHVRNPVKSDPSTVQCAGKPFVHDGALYRVAQDCSRVYGGAVRIMRVTRLNPSEYVEAEVAHVPPIGGSPYPDGLHTVWPCGEWTVIDGCRRMFVPIETAHKLKRWLFRAMG
jgi:hypothetical protein